MSRHKEIERVPQGDVMQRGDRHEHGWEHRMAVSPGYIASRQADMIEALLPLPRSAVAYRIPREPLLARLAQAAADALIEYKSLLVTPFIAAAVTGAASLAHYSTYRTAVCAAGLGLSAASLIVTAVASLVHINNETTPHYVGTQRAGHSGRIIATAFAASVTLLDVGVAALAGPVSGASWATGILAWLGISVPWAMWISDGRADAYAAETHRIGAVAHLAVAARTVTGQASTPAPPPDAAAVHPIGRMVVWALSEIGVNGAVVDGMPAVLDADRWTVTVVHPGTPARRVIARVDDLASRLGVIPGGLRITVGALTHQSVWSVNNVPLARLKPPGTHPAISPAQPEVSIWEPISLGLNDQDEPLAAVLPGTPGIFVAGNPRMGKSTVVSAIACAIVRASDCQLRTIDGAERDLTIFDDVAERHVGADIDAAILALKEVQREITDRGPLLKPHRSTELTRKIAEEIGLDCIGLIIDEVGFFTNHDDTKKRNLFNTLLRDIASRGGAVGIFLVLSTQKPESEVVPSAIRDMVTLRLALMCETIDQVQVILGSGMHKQCPAHELLVTDKGVGYIKGLPERAPCRIRTHQVTPEQRWAVVDAALGELPPTPPRGPGGGAQPEDGDGTYSRWGHLRPVPEAAYPDGSQVDERYAVLWRALDQFAEGFTYRDAGDLGVLGGRPGVQRPLDRWRTAGYLVQVAMVPGPTGHLTAVWRKATREEWRALNGEAAG